MAKKKGMRLIRVLAVLLAVILAVAAAYVAYVFIDYHRIDDRQTLEVTHHAEQAAQVQPGQTYTALTYNIGFGAYTPDYDFFMDGGTQSWAKSKESVLACVNGAGALAAARDADFVLFEEVDLNSTRSYHVDEKALLDACLPGYDTVCAVNYDSPFLFFPFTQPHGKSLSSLCVYSRFPITSSLRRQLPISTSVQKLLDLDRAYAVTRIPMADGRELVLYTIHMTAYTNDSSVRDAQLAMLIDDMTAEYEAGNAAICGGDFNMEMLQNRADEKAAAWTLPLERSRLGVCVNVWDTVAPELAAAQARSCRHAGEPYVKGSTDEWMLDSFLVTPNVTVEDVTCIDAGYTWSDHNPVQLTFRIN